MALNTVDEILRFAKLDAEVVQPSEVDIALDFASDVVEFLSPEDDSDRSTRVNPLRKRAEAYIATAEIYERIATNSHLTLPPKQILSVLGITIGTDFPTPPDVQRAFEKTADRYRELGERWANKIQPVVASITVSKGLDEE